MLLFEGRGARVVRLACAILLPLSIVVGAFLYFVGKRWGLSILVLAGPNVPVQKPATPRSASGSSSHAVPAQPIVADARGLSAAEIADVPAYAYEKRASGGGDDHGDEYAVR
ncbi:hypothetical protein ACP70R_043168 [Stipagrostis hirtigluma subsp. patula]